MLGMLALGTMVTVHVIYGHFVPRRQLLFYWGCFVAAYLIFYKLLDQPIVTLAIQTVIIFLFLLRGAQKDASKWMK